MSDPGFLQELLGGAGVDWMPLGDVCTIKTGPNINKELIAQRPGPYPVINSGREPLGYVDHFNVEDEPIGIASRGSVGLLTWTPGRFFRGNLNYSCSPKNRKELDTRFLYHYLMKSDSAIQALATHQGIPALNAGALKKLPVPMLPMEIQREIVRKLDTFTELIAELTAELEARKKQYRHYRNLFLASEDREIEWVRMDAIGEFIRGKRFTKADYRNHGIPAIHYGEIYTHYGVFAQETLSKVRSDMAGALRYAEQNDVIMAGVSETVEDVGKAVAWLGDGKVAIHDDSYAFRHNMNPKYIAYAMQTDAFHDQKDQFVSRGKIKRLLIDGVKKVKLPIPFPSQPEKSLAEQARIVSILDKFNALTTSLSEGLPREIELRQKQYEYYRDLLLSFPKPGEAADE